MKMIRIKEKEDCASWVDVNINSWNDHLKGIVSDKLLNFMKDNREARIKKEEETFVRDDYHYVLEDNKKIVGIMKLKDSEREGFENAG